MSVQPSEKDPFLAMVTARAEVDLKLSDFHPRSMLRTPMHDVKQPKFPVIDYHNHLDAQEPGKVLRIMDECRIERVVNITMRTGEAAIEMIRKFHGAAPDRFSTYGWMDWSDVQSSGFFLRSVERFERLVERGACGLKIWKDLGTIVRDADGSLLRIDDERLAQRDRVFARHPKTIFVGAHVAEHPEDLAYVRRLLDTCPNLFVDIGARCAELGRQPYTAREFFLGFADRILFGTDLVPEIEMYRLHFRFLETRDEYFEYPSHASRQGRWNIYGLYLPDDVLRKVYRENALRLLRKR